MNTPRIGNTSIDASSKSKYDYFGPFVIFGMTLLPMTTMFNLVRLGLAMGLLIIEIFKKPTISKKLLILFALMLLSLVFPIIAVLLAEGNLSNSSTWSHEFQRLLFYIVLIAAVYKYRVSFKFLYWMCIVTLLIHTTIQTLQWFEVEGVHDFIRDVYAGGQDHIHLDLALGGRENSGFRSGSIYLNPNVYMVIPLSVLCVILQANQLKASLLNYAFMLVALFSLLLTGSRTTLIVSVVLIAVYILRNKEARTGWKLGMLALFIVAIFILPQLFGEFRVFDIENGIENSASIKLGGLIGYLRLANPLYFFTGCLSSSLLVAIDAEWGYIFAYFGLTGLAWYIGYIRLMGRNVATLPFMSNAIRIVLCLIAMTASVVLCMPVFSFFCLLSLTKIEV